METKSLTTSQVNSALKILYKNATRTDGVTKKHFTPKDDNNKLGDESEFNIAYHQGFDRLSIKVFYKSAGTKCYYYGINENHLSNWVSFIEHFISLKRNKEVDPFDITEEEPIKDDKNKGDF